MEPVSPVGAQANGDAPRAIRICFFFNAQRHQLLHGISTAAQLANIPGFEVHVASPSPDHVAYARQLVDRLGGAPIRYEITSSRLLSAIRKSTGKSVPPKLLSLGMLASRLNRFDAIAIPERTSMSLKTFGAVVPKYVHLDHGAGDRAVGFDHRIAMFDMVLMAGDKHRDRLCREGLIRPGAHAIVGYPKFEAADAIRDGSWTPFSADRLTVLYNPHFSRLGSWDKFGIHLLRTFAGQDRYNLIVAPHVRMLDGRKKRAQWDAIIKEFSECEHIHIDPGSDRSIDMTYTTLADIYVGDVSSQVYEFLRRPKPCVFLDAHNTNWHDDENYGHWRFGPVVCSPDQLLVAVDAARASHEDYAEVQAIGFRETFAIDETGASVRAATAIAAYLRRNVIGGQALERSRLSVADRFRRAAMFAVAIGAGWLMHDAMGPVSVPAHADTAFVHRAVNSHQTTLVRGWMKSQPEVHEYDPREIQEATSIRMPEIPGSWRTNDVQIYPSSLGPIVQIALTTERGEKVSLVGMIVDTPGGHQPTLTSLKGDEVAYWEKGDHAFGLVGRIDAARLAALAAEFAA